MITHPEDLLRLEVDKEWVTIQRGFQEPEAGGLVRLNRLPRATLENLRDHLPQAEMPARVQSLAFMIPMPVLRLQALILA